MAKIYLPYLESNRPPYFLIDDYMLRSAFHAPSRQRVSENIAIISNRIPEALLSQYQNPDLGRAPR